MHFINQSNWSGQFLFKPNQWDLYHFYLTYGGPHLGPIRTLLSSTTVRTTNCDYQYSVKNMCV